MTHLARTGSGSRSLFVGEGGSQAALPYLITAYNSGEQEPVGNTPLLGDGSSGAAITRDFAMAINVGGDEIGDTIEVVGTSSRACAHALNAWQPNLAPTLLLVEPTPTSHSPLEK